MMATGTGVPELVLNDSEDDGMGEKSWPAEVIISVPVGGRVMLLEPVASTTGAIGCTATGRSPRFITTGDAGFAPFSLIDSSPAGMPADGGGGGGGGLPASTPPSVEPAGCAAVLGFRP